MPPTPSLARRTTARRGARPAVAVVGVVGAGLLALTNVAVAETQFLPSANYSVGSSPREVVLADLDGDGDLDAVTANAFGKTLSVRTNDGTGVLSARHDITTIGAGEPTSVGEPTSLAAGDLDGDGDADLVLGYQYANRVSVFLGNGNGTFAAEVAYATPNGAFTVALGDVDGDGDLDVATGNRFDSTIRILRGDGAGGLGAATSVVTAGAVLDLELHDLDEDGNLDLVAGQSFSDLVTVHRGLGGGTFAAGTSQSTSRAPGTLTVADLNGDGVVDVATANVFGNNVSLLFGVGDGTLLPSQSFSAGGGTSGIASADVDGDGDVDLAVAVGDPDRVMLFANDGSGGFTQWLRGDVGTSPTSTDPTDLVAGDMDGDGGPDFVTANERSASVSVLLTTNADTTAPSITIGSPVDGATYGLGETVLADYACVDETDPAPTCTGDVPAGSPVDTSTVGDHTFTVSSVDESGNTTTEVVQFRVAYAFEGFEDPIANAPSVNVVKAGRTVPVKWLLTDAGGAAVDDPASFVSLRSAAVPCDAGEQEATVEEEAAGQSGLQYLDAGRWQYNWQTPKAYAGSCRTMILTLADGTTHTASFRFT